MFKQHVSVAAEDFKMPDTCARRPSDFYGVCSNLASISSSLFTSTGRFLAGFLLRSDPVDLTFSICSRMSRVLGTVFPVNLRRHFLRCFLAEALSHTIRTQKHTVQRYI
jgi:hypothetical protein